MDAPRKSGPDDLKRIKGVGVALEKTLNDLGVYHYNQISKWTPEHIAWVDDQLRFKGRIARDGWTDQAAKLAEGGTTEFAARVDKGAVASSSRPKRGRT
jgi:NADH-quinone oxidoreductase subunit E